MNKRNIYIAAFIISILGLSYIQYKYLEIGLNLAKVQFNRKIGAAGQAIQQGLEERNQLTFLVGSALQKDTSFFKMRMDSVEDASSHFLNDFLVEKLVNEGIDAEFSYRMISKDSSFYLKSPVQFQEPSDINSYPLEMKGYLPDLLGRQITLELQFRDLNTYFLYQLNGLTLPGLLFIIGIIAAVIWALKTYYWQRRLISTTSEFISNLTHELKTPVFSIGLATKLLSGNSKPEQKPLLEIIRQEVDRLSNHIERVLELGSLESRRTVFNLKPLDFRPSLMELCLSFKTLVALEKVIFDFDLQPGTYPVNAEVFHLENAINNLLDNAKKYSAEPVIQLKAYTQNKFICIEITDNGLGLDKKDRKRIFRKYYRVSTGDLHTVKGYGLGLSYVKQVVLKHRGRIEVESEKGKGTRITIKIPLSDE